MSVVKVIVIFEFVATLRALRIGLKEVMVGGEDGPLIVFRITDTVLASLFAMTKSGFPSPSRSPVAT